MKNISKFVNKTISKLIIFWNWVRQPVVLIWIGISLFIFFMWRIGLSLL